MAKIGNTVTIEKIRGNDALQQHLAEIGFAINESITVVNKIGGNFILKVKESRIALNEKTANCILISQY